MDEDGKEKRRFVFTTKGVCPPEIHFQIHKGCLDQVRFVGGGCPGNASLVSRLIEGRRAADMLPLLEGIDCRNDTSCPDQLAKALTAVETGRLDVAESFRVSEHTDTLNRIALFGDIGGDADTFTSVLKHIRSLQIETVCSVGNVTGHTQQNHPLIKAIQQEKILALQGYQDWKFASGDDGGITPMATLDRDWLLRLPQVHVFQLADHTLMAFYGDFIQHLPGYSDFEPFALEMNMVCGLTDFMRDETVFPALEAMLPQFQADIVVFGQRKQWGHWEISGKTFISAGPILEGNKLSWGLLERDGDGIKFEHMSLEP